MNLSTKIQPVTAGPIWESSPKSVAPEPYVLRIGALLLELTTAIGYNHVWRKSRAASDRQVAQFGIGIAS